MSARGAGFALLALVSTAGANPPSFLDGVAAYEAHDPARCADVLLAVEAAGATVPSNGELLTVECLSAAGRFDEAFAYLRRQLPSGRIEFDELAHKSRPGLDALRQQPGWTALRAGAEALETDIDHDLREELLRRGEADQNARRAPVGTAATVDDAAQARIAAIDRENTAWLKPILEARGWPGSDTVGPDGARAVWMLVQHADHDPAFQLAALARMQVAVQAGHADRSDFALLTDRVRVANGELQHYGTQFHTGQDGITRMHPVEDADTLDARRTAVGLPSITEYRQMLREAYDTEVE